MFVVYGHRFAARAILAALALLLAIVGAMPASPVFAQQAGWVELGLQFADVRAIAVAPAQPEHLYVGGESAEKLASSGGMGPCGASVDLQCTYTDFFESRDGGATWTRRNAGAPSGPPATNVLAIAVDPTRPTTLYVSNGGPGVYKSTNGGRTWAARNDGLANGPYFTITTLLIDPRRPATLYAADSVGVLYRSTDGAASWQRLPVAPGARCGTQVLALAPDAPDTLFAGACEIDKSTDGGASWRRLPGAPGGERALAVSPSDANRVYAGVAPTLQSNESGTYRSTDGGVTWTRVDPVRRVDALAIDPAAPANVFTAGVDGVRWSKDGGQTWTALGNPAAANSAPYQDFHTLLVADGNLYYGTRGGLWKYPLPALAAPHDNRYFSQTGYRIDNDTIWDYFNRRGGIPTFGYPTSRTFTLQGFTVQFFQRKIVQLDQQGRPRVLNLLDSGLMPYVSFNGSAFPGVDASLVATAPDPTNQPATLAFVQAHAPNTVNSSPTNYYATFQNTVTAAVAFPNGGDASLLPGFDLELWGVPTSNATVDPNNHHFIYLRWQRGIMHYDATCTCSQGILLADYFKDILTGQNLPADLAQESASSPFRDQYDPSMPNWVHNQSLLPGTNLTDAFTPE